ncbi:hypothetical protein [Microbacterium deminutum]|uniref:DUF998 domain-containing protein n=1 Tax=Microbacterium deminutum TaxID=344164 RepID=A0ABN2RG72_9MICO
MSDAAQRTHRYLRVALVGIVIVILAGVVIEWIRSGVLPPSISHSYYTSARSVFVGSLVAASLALTVLSGSDAESAFLDMAAPFAPLIALIPAALDPASIKVEADGVITGVTAYLVALLLILIAGLILWRTKQLEGNWVRVTMIVALGVFLVVLALIIPAWVNPDDPNLWIFSMHYPATIAFFIAFATVPFINFFRKTSNIEPRPWQRAIYAGVVIVLAIDIPLSPILGFALPNTHAVLICEAVALLAFALFWLVQTIQRWNEEPGLVKLTPRLPRATVASDPSEA